MLRIFQKRTSSNLNSEEKTDSTSSVHSELTTDSDHSSLESPKIIEGLQALRFLSKQKRTDHSELTQHFTLLLFEYYTNLNIWLGQRPGALDKSSERKITQQTSELILETFKNIKTKINCNPQELANILLGMYKMYQTYGYNPPKDQEEFTQSGMDVIMQHMRDKLWQYMPKCTCPHESYSTRKKSFR